MVSPTKKILLATLLVNASRVLLAVVFMVSGFVKAVDPVGFMYKIKEYFAAFGFVDVPDFGMLCLALLFCGIEFIAGFFLLTGVYRRLVALLSFLMLLVYTPLTLYVALENPVPDCGCFGEAFRLTNWGTFVKNMLLLLFAAVVCFRNNMYKRRVSCKNRWMVVLFAFAYLLLLEAVSVWHLPVIDFRPYAIGIDLREAVKDVPSVYEMRYVYEKGGEQQVFTSDALPDSTWNYMGCRNELVVKGHAATAKDFSFIDRETGDDVVDAILADTGYVALVVMESLEKADESRVDKINDLYDYCKSGRVAFFAATSSGNDAVESWCKRTGAEYPLFWADDVMLKTVVRANPGLLLLKDGVVVGKWNINDVPEIDNLSPAELFVNARSYVDIMRGWSFWLLLFAVPVAIILFMDMFAGSASKRENSKE